MIDASELVSPGASCRTNSGRRPCAISCINPTTVASMPANHLGGSEVVVEASFRGCGVIVIKGSSEAGVRCGGAKVGSQVVMIRL